MTRSLPFGKIISSSFYCLFAMMNDTRTLFLLFEFIIHKKLDPQE